LAEITHLAARSRAAFLAKVEDAPALASPAAQAARDRLCDAIRFLGDGLGDIALRCCCLLEGLEISEKELGWSARSGKIVLRIALERLDQHYADTQGKFGPMIG